MSDHTLFAPYQLGNIHLNNKIIMAPMTRSRAQPVGVPDELNARYYAQRAGAGLIITEGTTPSPNGLGYPRIPGIYSPEQVAGWKLVTDAVHAQGGRIFLQVMHTGRVGHLANMPEGTEVVAPTSKTVSGEMYTDAEGPQPHTPPRLMNLDDIQQAKNEYVAAANNAIAAGFDGIELHGANGYLLEQFLNPLTNELTNDYGGSTANRLRFVVETATEVAAAIGGDKVGIRVSPYGIFNDTGAFEDLENTYEQLSRELGQLGLVYMHIVDHSALGAPEVPVKIKKLIRDAFGGTIILSGGYDRERAEQDLAAGLGHLVAYGRPFIANPDLVERLRNNAALADADHGTFYTPGEQGYTDYPTLAEVG
ncbi:MAG: alkene reductase [Bacteroidota bacterium]